ncbi:MAG TPA: MFS transporter, partial [Elusimicrobiota bacterium]|nr:MFS transporter [Elusimicrobiota bacterium]
MERIEKRSFWALMVTQFFGAFNDNVLKVLVQLLIVEWVIDPKVRSLLVDLCLAVFVAPFIIFSMLAGRVSDRTGKSRVIVGVQIWQLVVIAVAVASLFAHHIAAMIGSLFLLSMQAAFFSPAKYGVLPELMEEGELSNANGLLNMGTFLAILIGTVVGSFLVFHLPVACGLLAAAALCGLVASLKMEKLPPAKPGGPLALNPFTDLVDNLKLIRQDSALMLGIAAVNYFWFMGAVLQTNVFLYGKQMMNTTPQESGILLMAATVGIGLGSFLAGRLSSGKVELGLVPLGALGMSVFAIDLLWAYHSFYRALFDLFMMGMSGGFYEVPLNALIQWRSPSTERGRILATQNFLSFVAIGVASLAMSLMSLIMNPAQMLFALGLASLLGTAVIYSFLPEPLWRFVLYVLVNSLYRIRILGDRNVPVKGPALLVSNHLSMVDGLLVGAAVTRPVRFLIWRPYYEDKRLHWLMKAMKAIPISEKDPPRAILQSLLRARQALLEGELVCIFAEGQISRTGNLLEFKKGFEVIIKGLAVPVIPVNLDRVWGSIFSFEHGSVLFKRPRQIPYPVTVTFGEPVRPPITPSSVRQAVLDLGADAFRYRLESRQSLVVEFLKRAKQHPFQKAIADSSGRAMTYGMVTAVSRALAKHLRREDAIKPSATVGILLPPSVGGVLANVAVSLVGAIPVNLNYTSGGTAIQSAVEKAGIRRILTSRKLLQKASLPETPEMIYLEDIVRTVPKSAILRSWALFLLVPTPWLAKRFAPDADGDLDRT